MPELPEVQTVVNTLAPLLEGRVLLAIHLARTDILSPPGIDLPARLAGRRILHIARRAKRILFTLDDQNRFYIHLGMTGRLTVEPAESPLLRHTHLAIDLAPVPSNKKSAARPLDSLQLRFRDARRFGGIFWLGQSPADDNLGPEPLTLRPAGLARRLATTRRPIKSALLDQTVIAGLGNIYADEALFAARIHPLAPANSLAAAQILALNRAIKNVLRQAIRFKGSTLRDFVDANGAAGSYRDKHLVYDREGQQCPHCRRTAIQRIVLSGRSTCFCPSCQCPPE